VITAVLNRVGHLPECLDSVAMQRGVAIEHIVIDGGSTDGSVELLQRWSDRLAFWSSEADRGIGDAMNKGVLHARGRWLLFLHADDRLLSEDSLLRVSEVLAGTTADVAGFPIYFGSDGRMLRLAPRGANAWLRLKTGFMHQATFIRRSLFETIGLYDVDLKIAMDYEFFLRAWCLGVSMATFDAPIPTHMRDTGISSQRDWPSLRKRFGEERAVQSKHAGNVLARALYRVWWWFYLPYRRYWPGSVVPPDR
jgi:glycosyltransferase involved in cell wall biosynthesis